MKVRDLQVLLSKADPDSEVVVPGSDHSYRVASVTCGLEAESVGTGRQRRLYEWYGPENGVHHIEDPEGVVINVVVIS